MLALSIAAALWAPGVPELPDPPVQWRAPAGCPDVDRVQNRIADLLGRPLEADEMEMEGEIRSTSRGWTLSLSTRVGNLEDQRSLDANDCSVLADAAALVAVVMLDPVVAAATIEENAVAAEAAVDTPVEPPPEPAPLPAAEPDPQPESDPETDPDPEPDPRPRARTPLRPAIGLRARAGGSFGAVPRGTGVFDLGVSFGDFGPNNILRVELVGAYAIRRAVPDVSEPVQVSLGTVTPRACALLPVGPLEVPLCAGVELGAMRADSDAPGGGVTNAFWAAVQAEPGVAWAFTDRARLWAAAQVFVPLRFPEFEFVDPTDSARIEAVHAPQPVGARGLVGVEVLLAGALKR